MNILVTGIYQQNKGAELMLKAVTKHIREEFDQARVAISQFCGPYEWRCRHGLYQFLEFERLGKSQLAVQLLPASFRHAFGLLQQHEMNAVIDASGFAFGDQHPPERSVKFARFVQKSKRLGQKVILLPQSMGPFQKPTIRTAMTEVLAAADLIYARDPESFQYCLELAPNNPNLRRAPDFTITLRSSDLVDIATPSKAVYVVPNSRMIDKTSPTQAETYLDTLITCIESARSCHATVQLLIHDAHEDGLLVPQIQARLDKPISVINAVDPLELKGLIAKCALLIGSRYHALVGALSQGVPALGFGWSHKYQALFEDFNCPDLLLPVDTSPASILSQIKTLLSETGRPPVVDKLTRAAREHTQSISHMWQEVDKVLRNAPSPRQETLPA